MICALSSAHWQQASTLSSPCGALSRFEKIEIHAPINTIQYNIAAEEITIISVAAGACAHLACDAERRTELTPVGLRYTRAVEVTQSDFAWYATDVTDKKTATTRN